MRRLLLIALVLICAGAGFLWYRQSTQHVATTSGADSGQTAGRRNANADVAVVTAPVEKRDMPIMRRSFGYAEPMAVVAVRSRTDSQLLEQHFTEGQFVKKGDLLFTLDDRELQAQLERDQATLAKDQALRARAQNDLTRAQQLMARNAGTQQAVDQAVSDSKSADATVLGDQAAIDGDKLRLSYTKIKAPIAGRVGAVGVTPGNLVHANDTGTPLVTITQISPIRINFTLPQRDFDDVRTAMLDGTTEVRAFPRGNDKPISGRLTFIDSAVDTATGTVTLKAEFENKDMALWPGAYFDVSLQTAIHKDAAVIPTVAIQQGQDFSYVYVARQDMTAELRKVQPGAANGDKTEIISGLQPGERVVIDGQLRLTNGARIRTGENLQSRGEEAGRRT